MSKLARGTALAGAVIALTAMVSPVAQADSHVPAKRGYVELKAFEPAPVYEQASTRSRRAGTFQRGETARVWCALKVGGGGVWYSVQDVGGALWTYSGHFESSGEIKRC
ncbi:hypothetical protein [Streptomyces cucumeris]|uniref:hypothetical protein n=1 Tax=Streptomyces cucumeris TaxID=2962890 RepID=UPI0020C91A67|nr:hypothetical protein [Streptomyces sp. NEAU-Y11]MCP9212857.1 hypothetical protein [Streptomyces sp. NEAU-Y11]